MMMIRLVTEHPLAAGLLALLLLTLPTLVAISMPSSQSGGMAMVLTLPFQAITPLPIFVISLKRGPQSGLIAASILTAGTLLLSQEWSFSLMVFFLLAAFPLTASWMLHKGWNFTQSVSPGFFLGLLILMVALLVSANTPLDVETTLNTSLTAIQERFVAMAQSQGADAKTILEHRQALEQVFHLLAFLFPAMLVSGWFLLQLANLSLTRAAFARWSGYTMPDEKFADYKVPFFMVWPVIAFGLIMLLTEDPWYRFSANISLFLAIPYFFQGWAIMQKIFQRFKISALWRNVFYLFIFWSSKVALIVVLVGFFDTWLNIRNHLEITGEGEKPSGR